LGNSRWSRDDYTAYNTANTVGRSTSEVFRSHSVPDDLNPTKFKKRESRDSDANPKSNAIIIACDVTGSMGIIADNLIRTGIGTTFEEILKRAADSAQAMVTDPHLMVLGIGDAKYDQGPIQATQFEADIKIAEQLQRIWLEKGGGGNSRESYDLAWYFAAARTSIDCWEKRGKKGYLFTIGDECAPDYLSKDEINRFLGDGVQDNLKAHQMLEVVQRVYNVYHIIIEEGSFARGSLPRVQSSWREMLGQRVISLADHTKLAETIVSAIQINEGNTIDDVAKSWSGPTAKIVKEALVSLGA